MPNKVALKNYSRCPLCLCGELTCVKHARQGKLWDFAAHAQQLGEG